MMSHFLAIDDEPMVLKSLAMTLEALGHRVTAASSGREALALLEPGDEPDAIIADYRLRDENGVSVVGAVRDFLGDRIPALILTGDTAPERVVELHRSSLRVLHKPVGVRDLMGALDEIVSARRLRPSPDGRRPTA